MGSPDPRARALAADQASDYLRSRYADTAAVHAEVARLVEIAVHDNEEIVREAALHACIDAVSYHDLPLELFRPLIPLMPHLSTELLGYALAILGSTHDPAAGRLIATYADHPDPSVRAEVADALTECRGSGLGEAFEGAPDGVGFGGVPERR